MELEPSHSAGTSEHGQAQGHNEIAGAPTGGAPTKYTARGALPAVGSSMKTTGPSASDQAYGAGGARPAQVHPAFSKARDPLVRAQSDAAAIHAAPAEQRVGLLSQQMASEIDVLVYQCALARACSDDWAALKTHPPGGVDVGQIDAGAGQITSAQQAASSYDTGWMNHDRVWCEIYCATYIARHGAVDLGKQLNKLMPDAPTRSLVGHILGYAQRDGLLTAAQVTAASDPKSMTWNGAPATDVEEAAVMTLGENMGTAKARFDKAQATLKALDDKLQLELHEIGPALYDPNETDPKKIDDATKRVQAFIRSFQASPEYVKARAESQAAAKQLGLEAGQVGDDLLGHGHVGGADDTSAASRKSVLDTYEGLAGSEGGALTAVKWAQSHLADATFDATESARVKSISMLGQSTDATFKLQHVQQMMQDAAARATGPARKEGLDAAIAFIQSDICTPYADIKNIQGLTKLSQKLQALKTNAQIAKALASHDAVEAWNIAKSFVADAPAEADTIVRRVWSGMGSLIGLFNGSQTMLAGADPLKLFNTSKSMSDDLIALKGLFHGTAELTDAAERKKAFELVKKIHGGFGDLKTLGFGILNLAGSVMAIDQEWGVAQAHPDNVALQVQLAADIASAVGSALCLCPPLAPLGEIISVCGSVVSMIAGFFVGDVEGDDRRKQERQILSQPGIMPGSPVVGPPNPAQLGLAETFTTPDAADNLNAAQASGLTLTQIHELGQSKSWLFDTHGAISGIDSLRKYAMRHPELGHYSKVPTLYELLTTGLDAGLRELASRTDSWQSYLDSDSFVMNVEAMVVLLGMTIPDWYEVTIEGY